MIGINEIKAKTRKQVPGILSIVTLNRIVNKEKPIIGALASMTAIKVNTCPNSLRATILAICVFKPIDVKPDAPPAIIEI
jgi:hypothetical protein